MFLPPDLSLQAGDSGEYVSELQRRLAQRDLLGEANINGFFDGPTTQAVMEFQSLNGLRSDGIAGPETLRRLISIGANDSSSSGGGTASEEEEKNAALEQNERADMHAMAEQEQAEQDKLANEAVWGYGEQAAQPQQQAQQQLSDLDRYNQQHAQQQGQQQDALAMQRNMQHQHALTEGQPQALAQEHMQNANQERSSDQQLKVDQQGMKAQTLAQDLEKQPEHASAQKAEQQSDKQPEHAAQPKQALNQEQMVSANREQNVAATTPAPMRDAELARTESKLDAHSREESQEEGMKLEKRGVRNRGTVPETDLGDLAPDRSPARQRGQEVGRA